MSAAEDWGLHVNETGIFASGIARDRWLDFILRCAPERLTMLGLWPGGGEWHVMCGTRADAAEALETFLGVGFHESHVKVRRLSACRQAVQRKRESALERPAEVPR